MAATLVVLASTRSLRRLAQPALDYWNCPITLYSHPVGGR